MEHSFFVQELNAQLTYLYAFAGKLNELDAAAALSGEFRGSQDAGWSTTQTAFEVFDELKSLGTRGAPLTKPELRQVLSLYMQLAEAGGVYEGLLNTLQIAQLKEYNLWPFQKLVRVKKDTRAVIGPNANAMFRHLAEVADAIGMTRLSKLLEVTFRDDIRNGVAHADYIIATQGLRLRRRNGGQPMVLSYTEVSTALGIGLAFFELLQGHQRRFAERFRPARTVIGRFSANPPMPWKVEFTNEGAFSISTSSPGSQTDAAYERQKRINDRLAGRVVMAFVGPETDLPTELSTSVSEIGFELSTIAFESSGQLSDLKNEVDEHQLWDAPGSASESEEPGVLMATPFGFRRISDGEMFRAWLPSVDRVDIVRPPNQKIDPETGTESR